MGLCNFNKSEYFLTNNNLEEKWNKNILVLKENNLLLSIVVPIFLYTNQTRLLLIDTLIFNSKIIQQ